MTSWINVLLLAALPVLAGSPLDKAVWEKVTVPTESSLRGLSLPQSGVIWASGTSNSVVRSTDGGESWQVFRAGPPGTSLDFRDIWALDATTAWIMGAGPGASSCIYVTRNGGKSWQEEHTNTLEGAFFDGFTFWNNDTGMVYSDPVDGRFLLLKRKGQQWLRQQPEMPEALKGEASFAASGTGIISRGQQLWFGTGGAAVARVFHSSDHGKTWTVAPTPLRAGDGAAGVFSLAFDKSARGVIVGGKYNEPETNTAVAAYSRDGGKTWTLARTMPAGYRSCVAYIPGLKGTLIAAGTSGADFSTDHGETWQPLGKQTLNVLKPFDKHTAWAVGPEANVWRLRY